jgi:hypothetical protein
MAYTALYIATTDITDSLARDFVNGSDARLDTWMQNTDEEVQALALSLGVTVDVIYTPLNYRVKEYAVAYYCFLLFQDTYGENTVEQDENDIYKKKLEWYANRVDALLPQITKEMFIQSVDTLTPVQMVNTGVLYRA